MRNCPGCGKIQYYSFSSGFCRAKKQNRKCDRCKRLGAKHSEETKIKMSIASKGKKKSPEAIENNRKSHLGLKPSKETLIKLKNRWKIKDHPWIGRHHTKESRKKMSMNKKGVFSGEKNPMFGKTHSKETVERISRLNRIRMIEKLKKTMCNFHPPYNEEACKYFDILGEQNNWNIKHALNGGEHHVEELGYWIDGYDIDKNIVIEYDEQAHFNSDGSLKEKDIQRMNRLIEHLKCNFYRFNEVTKELRQYS